MEEKHRLSSSRVRLRKTLFFTLLLLLLLSSSVDADDASVMQDFKKSLKTLPSGWEATDPSTWTGVQWSKDNRVTRIRIRQQNLTGSLPPNLGNLTALQSLDIAHNQLTGPLPSLAGLSSVQDLLLSNNEFTSIPPDFFTGMISLQQVSLDYNSFSPWVIPDSLRAASALQVFSATNASISGKIPDFFGGDTFAGLTQLHLAFNLLEGELPKSFSGSTIQSLWLNGQKSTSKLTGRIDVLQNMTQLSEVWLHSNSFSGPLPDLSGLTQLQNFSVRDNSFSGPVPGSLMGLKSLQVVNLTNNMLQGPTPEFGPSVAVDVSVNTNSFCLPDPGVNCDIRVSQLLDVAQSMEYPKVFAENWKGLEGRGRGRRRRRRRRRRRNQGE